MDGIELVIAIEARFGIKIADEDAEYFQIVGQVYDYVLERATFGKPSKCLSAAAFYQLRRGLGRSLNIDRDQVRPPIRLDTLLERSERALRWDALAKALDWRLPELRRPKWMVEAIFHVAAATFVVVWLIAGPFASSLSDPVNALVISATLAMVFSVGIAGLVTSWTGRFAIEFTEDCATVSDLVRSSVVMNHGKVAGGVGTPGDVWEALRAIVAHHAGVEPSFITEETSFVNDLGLD